MNECYITRTGAFLPGEPVDNESIHKYLGRVIGESRVREKILTLNGIRTRHYALDEKQQPTHDLYDLASEAVKNCFAGDEVKVQYLSAGSTNTPLVAPGLSTLLHERLRRKALLSQPLEINSNSGICSSGAQALVNAVRAIRSGDATAAVSVGVDQPSAILKSKAFRPTYDIRTIIKDIRHSKWFMSVFLRFMLSDGAGACVLQSEPNPNGLSLRVDWSYSRSFANEAPLCMKLESRSLRLSQDVRVLSKYMMPFGMKALSEALERHAVSLEEFDIILPHMSSYYFEPKVRATIRKLAPGKEVPFWTNLKSAGNTGAASAYIMLDEFFRSRTLKPGERILLFVPESGQFNYVLISMTAV